MSENSIEIVIHKKTKETYWAKRIDNYGGRLVEEYLYIEDEVKDDNYASLEELLREQACVYSTICKTVKIEYPVVPPREILEKHLVHTIDLLKDCRKAIKIFAKERNTIRGLLKEYYRVNNLELLRYNKGGDK